MGSTYYWGDRNSDRDLLYRRIGAVFTLIPDQEGFYFSGFAHLGLIRDPRKCLIRLYFWVLLLSYAIANKR
jgi:hypothetical protein